MTLSNKYSNPKFLLENIISSNKYENSLVDSLDTTLAWLQEDKLKEIHQHFLEKLKTDSIQNKFNKMSLQTVFEARFKDYSDLEEQIKEEDGVVKKEQEIVRKAKDEKYQKNQNKVWNKGLEKIKEMKMPNIDKTFFKKDDKNEQVVKEVKSESKGTKKEDKKETKEKKITTKKVKTEVEKKSSKSSVWSQKKKIDTKVQWNDKYFYKDWKLTWAEFKGPFSDVIDKKNEQNEIKNKKTKPKTKKVKIEGEKKETIQEKSKKPEKKPEKKIEKSENKTSNKKDYEEAKENVDNLPSRTKIYPELFWEWFLSVKHDWKIKKWMKKIKININQKFKLNGRVKSIWDKIELQLYKATGIKDNRQYKPQNVIITLDELSYCLYFSNFEIDAELKFFDEELYPMASRLVDVKKNMGFILDWLSLSDVNTKKEFDTILDKEIEKYLKLSVDSTKTIKIQRIWLLLSERLHLFKDLVYKKHNWKID